MRRIECTSKAGISTFFLEGPIQIGGEEVVTISDWQKPPARAWRYRVHLRNPPQPGEDDFYEAAFVEIDPSTALSCSLNHNGRAHYRGKGITPQVFAHAFKDLNRKIISSTVKGKKFFDRENRSPDATTVWCKLVMNRCAIFDDEIDRYEYIGAN